MKKKIKHILISVGEASGDMHAANLAQTVKKIAPNIRFYGMGAHLMRNAEVDIIVDANDLSIIGWFENIHKILEDLESFSHHEKRALA